MTDDGKEYEYVYDPFGRLRKIKNTSNQALVAEYWYNGLGHRITWHSDTSRSGGGAPDGTVNTDDPKVHFVYNERWQVVAVYRQANGSNVDTYPKEQFVSHAAGFGGFGGSSYIDGVILRDDHEDDWTEAADSTMERRVYYCQNWRADVIAILAENGRVLERAWYEPYGTPHGMSPADLSGTSDDTNDHYLVPDGDADADDSFVYLDLFGVSAGLSDTTGSSDPGDPEYGRPNGTVDSDDYFYYLDVFGTAAALGRNVLSAGHDGATASHGAGNMRNRKGLAGYEWDPHVRRYHVRNRVLYPETGRWTRRDPLGNVDGQGLYEVVRSVPMPLVDPSGLCSEFTGCPTDALTDDPLSAALGDPSSILGDSLSLTHASATPPFLRGIEINGQAGGRCCIPGPLGARICLSLTIRVSRDECECVGINGTRCTYKWTDTWVCFAASLEWELDLTQGIFGRLKGPCRAEARGRVRGSVPMPPPIYPPDRCPPSDSGMRFTGDLCLRCGMAGFECQYCLTSGLRCGGRWGFNSGKGGKFRPSITVGCGIELRGCVGWREVDDPGPCFCEYVY